MFCEIPEFGRCCFCLPLRRGILIFGYLNILFAGFMVGVFSYAVHHNYGLTVVFHGVSGDMDNWVCLVLYCADIIFSAILLYGAHRQIIILLRVFYYYALCTLAVVIIMEIIVASQRPFYWELELFPVFFAGLWVHVYTHVWFAAVLYVSEIIFNIVLLVGAHMKKTQLMRAYYYYGITTTLASLVTFFVLWLSSINTCTHCFYWSYYIVLLGFVLSGVGIQVYLLLLIRSELLKIRQHSRLCYVNHASEIVVDTPLQTGHNPF
ncbi:uncharacterized protein [Maniola hyperantus]|uniref:uncharacterized protein isoform X1 n=1 Tax=Aphantopus hyperantus TaxID=2795564 RepID=UPI0037492046